MRLLEQYGELLAAGVFAALAALLALGGAPLAVRLPFGLVAVLLLPGYGVAGLAFPRQRDLSGVERLALSIGLSLAVIAFLALALDRSPWGLSFTAVVVALTAWTLFATALAAWRRHHVPGRWRYALVRPVRWRDLDQATRRALMVLAGAVVLSATALTVVLTASPPPQTEFYILGPEGLAENYPRAGKVGEPLRVTMGISNREGRDVTYQVSVFDVTGRSTSAGASGEAAAPEIGNAGPVRVGLGATLEQELTFTPRAAGKDRQIQFLLYLSGGSDPYRQLRLWLDVNP